MNDATKIINPTTKSEIDAPANEATMQSIKERYEEEKEKRLRDDGNAQYIDASKSAQFEQFGADPWVDPVSIEPISTKFPDNQTEMLIVGAGWGGIQYAVQMIKSGILAQNIRIIDPAGGFGGTWYWNRYPGLMCDVESYIYLPFLEETGYVPRQRYSCGEEILEYANLVTRHFGLVECGVFQTQAEKLVWDDDAKIWHVDLVQSRKGEDLQRLSVLCNFVSIAVGVLNWLKFPDVPGILDYRGEIFHTSRWAYDITGGSPKDPVLDKLKNRTVAIIGTGACSIQAVPELARWCKHLYVIQRTPASVDIRDQRETDVNQFNAEVCTGKGWQRERMKNFNAHFTLGEPPAVNLVDDEWTRVPALVGITGNPNGPIPPSEIAAYTSKLIEIDIPRQNRIRTRVDEQVNDPVTAVKLKPWYPSFCKRPLLHDDYLATFNKSNVSLIDTDGKGVDGITADSLVIGKKEYKADIIIFATGYRSPSTGTTADKANLTIIGKNGVSMSTEWPRVGLTTLHGILDVKFPNLFLSGPQQAGLSGNYAFTLGEYAKHAAYILSESKHRSNGKPFAVAPTAEAAEHWAALVTMNSPVMAVMAGCTPGYYNLEGEMARLPVEYQTIAARSTVWGSGIEDWLDVIEKWRAAGRMDGIEVRV